MDRQFADLAKKEGLYGTLASMTTGEIGDVLRAAKAAYYNGDGPALTDAEYDAIEAYYAGLPDHLPEVLESLGPRPTGNQKVRLPYYMGSLDKIKKEDSGRSLDVFVARFPPPYVVSDKLDGVSALVVFDGGARAPRMYTRGDGRVGQDISRLVPMLKGGIPRAKGLARLAVRGELVISRRDFEDHLRARGANARNLVSGCVNAKDPDPEVLKRVQFVAYSRPWPATERLSDALASLARLGFTVVNHDVCDEALDAEYLSARLRDRRAASEFEADGIVVTHDGRAYEVADGVNPAHAFAYKSLEVQDIAEVTVERVVWTATKDGYLVPVVEFETPVQLAGVMVKRATGFNAGFIQKNAIGAGARVRVTRSGDVIPHIVDTVSPAPGGRPCLPPGEWKWTESGKHIVLVDPGADQGVAAKQIENFFKKLEVRGAGAGVVARLVSAGFDTIPKVLAATVDDLRGIPGFGAKSSEALVTAIRDTTSGMTLVDVMNASNAFGRFFGRKRLQAIVDAFPRLASDRGFVPSAADLESRVEGVSSKLAQAFITGLREFNDSPFALLLQISQNNNNNNNNKPSERTPNVDKAVLLGFKVVFTGFRDKDLEARIVKAGGRVEDSILERKDDPARTLLVFDKHDTTTTKAKKAAKIGARALSKDAFVAEYLS
jgi:DNA ligase (NAD+)